MPYSQVWKFLETLLFNLRGGVVRMELYFSLACFTLLRGSSFRILNLSY
jgi:hypothetical protein